MARWDVAQGQVNLAKEAKACPLYDVIHRKPQTSPVATGGLWWANPPKHNFKSPKIEIKNTTNQEFLSNFRMSSPPAQT